MKCPDCNNKIQPWWGPEGIEGIECTLCDVRWYMSGELMSAIIVQTDNLITELIDNSSFNDSFGRSIDIAKMSSEELEDYVKLEEELINNGGLATYEAYNQFHKDKPWRKNGS